MSDTVENSVGKSSDTKKKRILLAEDDSTTRLFLFNQLKKRGLEVDTASTGNIVLKKLKGGAFDAVVLDLMIPGVKGRELIKQIRKNNSDIPVFVVTSAQRMELARKRSAKAGATRVIDKAAPVEKIVAEIVGYLIPSVKGDMSPVEKRDANENAAIEDVSATQTSVQANVIPDFAQIHRTSEASRPATPKAAVPSTSMLNTELLRKIAKAGQAARGTPPPVVPAATLSADTPLLIPEEGLDITSAVELPALPALEAVLAPPPAPPKPDPTIAAPVVEPPQAPLSRAERSTIRDLEDQLAELRRTRDEMAVLLRDQPIFGASSEGAAELQETLDDAKAATKRAEAAYQAELARSRQFEEELKRIREARDELNRKLASDEKTAEESQRRSLELEQRLAQRTGELEQAKAELEKNAAERSSLVFELREQINSARQSAESAKVAYDQQAARAQNLAEELENLRKAREELNARLQAEMQKAAEWKRRIEEREQQLREREAEVERLKSELNRRTADSELSQKLSQAQDAARNAQVVYKEEAARGAQSEKELARLTQARDELNAKLAREEQTAADARRRSEEMELQLATRNAELVRLKSDLDRQVEERKTLELELQQQVTKASDAAERVRREFQKETTFSHRSTADQDALRQARDELNARLEREQQLALESRRHSNEVESKLQAATQELVELRAKLEKHAEDQTTRRTVSGPASKGAADETTTEPAKSRPGLAQRIIAPFKIFSSRSENPAIRQLEEQLSEVTRNRDELLVLLRDRSIAGLPAGPDGQPETADQAKTAAKRAEAAHQAQLARSRQFEEELKRIREARDQLNRRLVEEEKAAEESRRRSKELEERLERGAAELVTAKAELQKTVAEHSALEQSLRQQLQSTQQFAESTRLAFQKQAAFAQRLNDELTELQKVSEELNARVQAGTEAAAESKRRLEERDQQMRESEAEVERLQGELAQRSADKQLSAQLAKAQNAARTAQAACKQEAARGAQAEKALARLNQAREELNAKLASQEQADAEASRRTEEIERQLADRTAELDRLKSELQRHGEERKTLEKQLQQQVARVSEDTRQTRRDFQQETSFFHRSSGEVDALRRARDELNVRFEHEQQAAVEARRYIEELEKKLETATGELGDLRAALEQHGNERAALVSESSRQLQAVKTAAVKAEKAYKEQLKRSAKFEKDLAALQHSPAPASGRKPAGKSGRKVQELEKQIAAQAAELEKARVEFEQIVSERQRLEQEHRRAHEPAQAPAPADARFRECLAALARVTAELEKEQSARRRGEERAAFLSGQLHYLQEKLRSHLEIQNETQQRVSECEQQLRERDAELGKAGVDLQKEAASRRLVQAQLKASGDVGNQFQEQFSLLDEARRVFNAAQDELQSRLETTVAAQKQTELELQKQVAERKRVRDLLEDTHRKLEAHARNHTEQVGQLQSTLELQAIELRKQESRSLQSQYASIDASRLGSAFVNSFRAHLRPAAEQLLQRTRLLLEVPLEAEQKKIVEAALESALMLQASMQTDAPLPGETDGPGAAKAA